MDGNDVIIISNSEGSRTTPSVVAFTEDGERLVGQIAKRQAITNPGNTVFAAKRLLGRKHGEEPVQRLMKMLPYDLVGAANGDVQVCVWGKSYSPSELAAQVLNKMKESAEAYLGHEVKDVVVTVPAYFDDAQRQATKDAGRIAGLNVLRIINEPTAATLAYGIGREEEDERMVAVYDMGGGTFDISVLQLRAGVFEVLATGGDTFLGGEDFDNAVVNWAMDEFRKIHGITLEEDKLARQRLKEASEKAKQELSWSVETEINLPFIAQRSGQPIHLELTLTREQLEKLTSVFVERSLAPCRQALEDAELSPEDIDEVIL
ncbi:MAG: Hsp70 family protein, partial [Nannocystaceae bacterium]